MNNIVHAHRQLRDAYPCLIPENGDGLNKELRKINSQII